MTVTRRSSIKADPRIRAAVDAALHRGSTIDEIVAGLQAIGADVSRSAVGRYAKDYSALAAHQRDLKAVAETFGAEFGEEGDKQGRMMVQLLTSLITRAVMPIAAGDEPDLSAKTLADLARAVKDASSASKIETDREQKVAEAAAKKARAAAAVAATGAARAAGASAETIDTVRRAILGIS